jgi:hypothetical protein
MRGLRPHGVSTRQRCATPRTSGSADALRTAISNTRSTMRGECGRFPSDAMTTPFIQRWTPTHGRRGHRGARLGSSIVGGEQSIFVHRQWGSALQRGYAWGAERLGRHEPNRTFATPACRGDTLALDVVKEGALLWPVNVPEAEIIVTDRGHFERLPF